MTNIELLKKYATICKRHGGKTKCEECELNNSCWVPSITYDTVIDDTTIKKLIKDIKNTKTPCRVTITIFYSVKMIPQTFSTFSPQEIGNFFQKYIEDMIMPIISNVINAEWAECVSIGRSKCATVDGNFFRGVQSVEIDIEHNKRIKKYRKALSTEIRKVFKLYGLDTDIKIDFEA